MTPHLVSVSNEPLYARADGDRIIIYGPHIAINLTREEFVAFRHTCTIAARKSAPHHRQAQHQRREEEPQQSWSFFIRQIRSATMTFEIEKGIAAPKPVARAARPKYPFGQMQVGDSFVVPSGNPKLISSAAYNYGKKRGLRFCCRTIEEDGKKACRVWRLKNESLPALKIINS